MHKIKILTLLLAVLFVSACSMTTSRQHPTLHDELKRVDSVVIVPPAVTIELLTLTGENERLTEKEQEIKLKLTDMAKTRLKEQGFDIVDFDFEQALVENEDFAYAVTQVREGFSQAKKDLEFGRPLAKEKASEVRASVGEAANMLQAMSGADAILLISFNGVDKSSGHVAKDVATGVLIGVLTMGAVVPVPAKSAGVTEVALLDGVSGEVLWADTFSGPLSESLVKTAMVSMPADVDEVPVAESENENAAAEVEVGIESGLESESTTEVALEQSVETAETEIEAP